MWGLVPTRDKDLSFTIDPPFGAYIMMKSLPRYLKMPQLEIYNRFIDPIDHLDSFKTSLLLHGTTNGVLYRVFPSTLKKSIRY